MASRSADEDGVPSRHPIAVGTAVPCAAAHGAVRIHKQAVGLARMVAHPAREDLASVGQCTSDVTWPAATKSAINGRIWPQRLGRPVSPGSGRPGNRWAVHIGFERAGWGQLDARRPAVGPQRRLGPVGPNSGETFSTPEGASSVHRPLAAAGRPHKRAPQRWCEAAAPRQVLLPRTTRPPAMDASNDNLTRAVAAAAHVRVVPHACRERVSAGSARRLLR